MAKYREQLNHYLRKYATFDKVEIADLLRKSWDEFTVSDDSNFKTYKLDRIEDLKWQDPILSFKIERHGGTVAGSTRAEMYEWMINLDTAQITSVRSGYRQLVKMNERFDAEKVVNDLIESIKNEEDTATLKWSNDRNRLTIDLNQLTALAANINKQTRTERRKKFNSQLSANMEKIGWRRVSKRLLVFEKDKQS